MRIMGYNLYLLILQNFLLIVNNNLSIILLVLIGAGFGFTHPLNILIPRKLKFLLHKANVYYFSMLLTNEYYSASSKLVDKDQKTTGSLVCPNCFSSNQLYQKSKTHHTLCG